MFARVAELPIYAEKKNELIKTVRREVVPILQRQPGFIDLLPLFPEDDAERMIAITLWTEERYEEKYGREVSAKVEELVKFFLTDSVTWKVCEVETSLCQHLVEALTAGV